MKDKFTLFEFTLLGQEKFITELELYCVSNLQYPVNIIFYCFISLQIIVRHRIENHFTFILKETI